MKAEELVNFGVLPQHARLIGTNGKAKNLSAAGSTASDGTKLTCDLNHFSTCDAGQGCVLPKSSTESGLITIVNGGANTMKVYPALNSSDTINNASSFDLGTGVVGHFFPFNGGFIRA